MGGEQKYKLFNAPGNKAHALFSDKSQILQFLRETYKPDRISYPFVVWGDNFVVGYNPGKYEELIKLGGN